MPRSHALSDIARQQRVRVSRWWRLLVVLFFFFAAPVHKPPTRQQLEKDSDFKTRFCTTRKCTSRLPPPPRLCSTPPRLCSIRNLGKILPEDTLPAHWSERSIAEPYVHDARSENTSHECASPLVLGFWADCACLRRTRSPPCVPGPATNLPLSARDRKT